jgi:hypothetical protein
LPTAGFAVTNTEHVGQPLSADTWPRTLMTSVNATPPNVTTDDTVRTTSGAISTVVSETACVWTAVTVRAYTR